jgi:hypothetical protein
MGGGNRALPPEYDRRWLYTVVFAALDDDEGLRMSLLDDLE